MNRMTDKKKVVACVCVYLFVRIRLYLCKLYKCTCALQSVHLFEYMCVPVCMRVCVPVCMCVFVCQRVCARVCASVYACACMSTYARDRASAHAHAAYTRIRASKASIFAFQTEQSNDRPRLLASRHRPFVQGRARRRRRRACSCLQADCQGISLQALRICKRRGEARAEETRGKRSERRGEEREVGGVSLQALRICERGSSAWTQAEREGGG